MLTTAIAFSLHLSVSGMNAIHPSVWIEENRWKAGVYLNSYEEVSLFAGRRFGNKLWADIGVVTGYDYPIGARFGIDTHDKVSLWTIPAPESVVIGIEFRL